jgi:putative ABC transport system permease protein
VRSWPEAAGQNPYRLLEGAAPRQDDEVVLDRDLARRAEARIGDRVTVVSRVPSVRLTVSGVVGFGGAASAPDVSALFTTRATAQRLTDQAGGVHRILVTAQPDVDVTRLARRVAAAVGDPAAQVLTGERWRAEGERAAAADVASYRALLSLFAALALVLGVFVVANAFAILGAQRRRETALLAAVGATPRQLRRRVALEALACGAVGGAVGLPLGVALAAGLQRLLQALDLAVRAGAPVLRPTTLLAGLVVGVVASCTAAAVPALRAGTVPPSAALREAALPVPVRGLRRSLTAGTLALLGAAAAVAGARTGPAPVVLGLLLLVSAAVVAGPLLVASAAGALGRVHGRLGGVAGELAAATTRRSPARAAAAALTVTAGVGVVSVVLLVATSVQASFSDTLEQRFRGAGAVLPAGASTGLAPGLPVDVAPEVLARARAAGAPRPVVLADTPVRGLAGPGAPSDVAPEERVSGVDDVDALVRTFDLGTVSGRLDDLGPGTVALHAATARARGWSVGSVVTLGFLGGPRTYRVVAVYGHALPDEVPVGQALLTRAELGAAEPRVLDRGVYLGPAAPPDARALRAGLQAALADSPVVEVLDRPGYVAAGQGDLDRILTGIYVILALAVLTALLGVATTLQLSTLERTREIGVLRALGLTGRQLRAMLRWESLTVTLVGAGLGVVLGLGGGALVLPVLGDGRVAVRLPVPGVLVVAAGALLAGVALARPAARQGLRITPVEALSRP